MGQQQFHAVQCFSCSTFQVQQVKKVAKFKCAVCGDKQSVRQVCPAAGMPRPGVKLCTEVWHCKGNPYD